MTLDEMVHAARSRAGDVDNSAYRYTKNELVVIMKDAARTMGVRGQLAALDTFVFDTTENLETVTPEPSNIQGLVLSVATALRVLQQTYRRRVDDGSLGISWMSGLEQESSISAQKAYEGILKDIAQELEELKIFVNSKTFASRVQ